MAPRSAGRYSIPMAFDTTARACLIATIARVEASGDYGCITAPDTLSLGIGQWTQGRAYDLLKRFSAGTDFGGTVNAWLAEGRDSWTIPARKYQYLDSDDRAKLSGALDSAEGHQIQDSQMSMDIDDSYIPRVRELGLDPESETDAFMLFVIVMHRWGNYGSILPDIVSDAGHPATLDSMAQAIKWNGEWDAVGQRYEIAYQMIRDRVTDGVQISPSPGNTGNKDSHGGISANKNLASLAKQNRLINYVRENGDGTLHIQTSQGPVTAHPTSTGYWTCSPSGQRAQANKNMGGLGKKPSTEPPTGDTATKLAAMTKCAWDSIGKYVYYQHYLERLDPENSGETDCSGFCWYLYNKFFGIDIDRNGTAAIIESPTGTVVAEGDGSFDRPDLVREGDLLVCRWWSGGGHIEYCTGGDGGWQSIGQRGPDGVLGPDVGSLSMFTNCTWKLKRYV